MFVKDKKYIYKDVCFIYGIGSLNQLHRRLESFCLEIRTLKFEGRKRM